MLTILGYNSTWPRSTNWINLYSFVSKFRRMRSVSSIIMLSFCASSIIKTTVCFSSTVLWIRNFSKASRSSRRSALAGSKPKWLSTSKFLTIEVNCCFSSSKTGFKIIWKSMLFLFFNSWTSMRERLVFPVPMSPKIAERPLLRWSSMRMLVRAMSCSLVR